MLQRGWGRQAGLDRRLLAIETAYNRDQSEHRQQRRCEQQAVDDQPIEIAKAEQRRRTRHAGSDLGAGHGRTGHSRAFEVQGLETRIERCRVGRGEVECACIERFGHQGGGCARALDEAPIRLCEDADAAFINQLRPDAFGRLPFADSVKLRATTNRFERSARDEQAFHARLQADKFRANMASQCFGLTGLLNQGRVIGKLALFKRLQG
ncbi:MAG: hypothetical protein B7Z38_03625 [Rhodobacterales bacterium 12-64-8]|nr:MAG: hypothetical protein B7Z38_03625 [Rhodobacterales bacterium 12-64-8]